MSDNHVPRNAALSHAHRDAHRSEASEPHGAGIALRVRGLDCPDCAASLERAVAALPGVAWARLDFTSGRLRVIPADAAAPSGEAALAGEIEALARDLGHALAREGVGDGAPDGMSSGSPGAARREWLAAHRRDLATGTGALLLALGLLAGALGAPDGLVLALKASSIAVSGYFVARAGWVALRRARTLDMNALMAIAAVGALIVGEATEGAVAILLFSVGELLESYAADRARNAIRLLMRHVPREATLLEGSAQRTVAVESLAVGDRILVRPGERLPMDGAVLEGHSGIDQSPITGESMPVERGPGDAVFAGSINGQGALTLEVTRLAADSTIARILYMVEEAQSQRAPSQRFVDRFARIYTPVVIGLAVLVALVPPLLGLGALSDWVYRALVLLVISCPCALVISTPVTIVSALARAARGGVLIKGGRHLEALGRVRAVAFDKTGTLTKGTPEVVAGGCELHPGESQGCDNYLDILAKAAAIEARSEHALARALVDYAEASGVNGRYAHGRDVVAASGRGIIGNVDGHRITVGGRAFLAREGDADSPFVAEVIDRETAGHTVIMVDDACCEGRCYLAVADAVREEAAGAVEGLRAVGIAQVAMLTGDNAHTAASIAETVGIDQVRAELLPGDKVDAVRDLMARYGDVIMVGDGVNDAPALAAATVGVAMGAAGTDVALETADVALMGDDLMRLPFAVSLARRALGIIRANIALSLAIKAVFVALAVAGLSTLWMAVFADVGVSLLVTLNGLRLLGHRE